MPRRRRTPLLAALALTAVALATSGCLGLPDPDPQPRPTLATSRPSPTASPAKDELVAALGRLVAGPYRYHVQSNLPEPTSGTVDATGAYDHDAKLIDESVTLAGGRSDGFVHRLVVDHDLYTRTRESDKWIHLDLTRARAPEMHAPNLDDPTGLASFITTIAEATRTGPHSFKGRFDPHSSKPFMPIGYPGVVAFMIDTVPFTAETDDQGNVTSIHMELEIKDKPKLDMTTTFSDHGKPLGLSRPARNKTSEAAGLYYK
ncbi:hypothetical protein [Dactylosporangium sp. NPDC051484]|uniref:hypothetical protein n=1 Tax=Dactylosporangium sp. NPDC051484 TaxID=3154942 RepID=UPI00344C3718